MLLSWQRRWPWRQRRKAPTSLHLLLIFCFILLIYTFIPSTKTQAPPGPPHAQSNSLLQQQAKFWRVLYENILFNDPKCDKDPERVVPRKLDIAYDPGHDHPRADILWMDAVDIKRMQKAHDDFVLAVNTTLPELVYNPGTRGLVVTAGFSQLPVLVISLRMLRRTSSLLPVEVFLGSHSEYDVQVCDHILPTLNAKCIIFSDIVHAAETGISLDKFQYKIMSILFSSFEDVLMLDADAFPIYDPAELFAKEPFNTTGMITWPDFWYASESPYFFEIARLGQPPKLNAQPSTESGELMYSKSKHGHSLMLAAYYNYYGPQYYYLLQSQGGPGQGDKETFGWAAKVMGESSHAVHEPVIALGHIDSNGAYFGSAMAQHDPARDFAHISGNNIADEKEFGKPHTKGAPNTDHKPPSVRPFFVHANFPKFDPVTIFAAQAPGQIGPTRDSNGTSVRCWLDAKQIIKIFGFDLERRFWEEIMGTACEYEQLFGCWEGKTGICERVKKYWNDVFVTKS